MSLYKELRQTVYFGGEIDTQYKTNINKMLKRMRKIGLGLEDIL